MLPPLPSAGKTAGNSTPPCVCSGDPPASNVDTLTPAVAAAAPAFVNPEIEHRTGVVGDAGAATADKLSSSTPDCSVMLAVTTTLDGLRLEQLGAAALALKAEKRRPVIEIVLKGIVVYAAAVMNDALAVTLVAPAR
jgi:hypothetical protein